MINNKHIYSTACLILILFLTFSYQLLAVDVEDISVCDENDMVLTINGHWECSPATLSELDINATIDAFLQSTTYTPTSFYTLYGTESGGNNVGNLSLSDSQTFNLTESNGVNAMELYINFTNVTKTPDFICMAHQYTGTHFINMEVWDYTSEMWENYDSFGQQVSILRDCQSLVDGINHLENETVEIRFIHPSTGVQTHDLFIDYVLVISGFGVSSSDESDPFALYKDGSNSMEGNLSMNNNSVQLNTNKDTYIIGDDDEIEFFINDEHKLHLSNSEMILHGDDISLQFIGDSKITDPEFDGSCGVEWTCSGGWTIQDGYAELVTPTAGSKVLTPDFDENTIIGREYIYCVEITEFNFTGNIGQTQLKLGTQVLKSFVNEGKFCETFNATQSAVPTLTANRGIGTIYNLSVTFFDFRLQTPQPSKLGDTEFWGKTSYFEEVDMSLADLVTKSYKVNARGETGAILNPVINITSPSNIGKGNAPDGSNMLFATGSGGEKATGSLDDGSGGDEIHTLGSCGGACTDARDGAFIIAPDGVGYVIIGRDTLFAGANGTSILQVTGDVSIDGGLSVFSPKNINYDLDSNKLIDSLPKDNNILLSDGHLNWNYLDDNEKSLITWVEYPRLSYQCYIDWENKNKCGMLPDKTYQVNKSKNRLELDDVVQNNRIMINELTDEIYRLKHDSLCSVHLFGWCVLK